MTTAFHSLMSAVFRPDATAAELTAAVQAIMAAAKQTESFLNAFTLTDGGDSGSSSGGLSLRQETAELRRELSVKSSLLDGCSARLSQWAERYRQMEDDNEQLRQDSHG